MLSELHNIVHVNEYIESITCMSQSIYCHMGWNQELFEYVFVTLTHSYNRKTEEVYIEFIYLLEEAFYTMKTCEDFTDFLVFNCQDSITSMRYMCVILQKTLEALKRFVAI
jgi:hypothetical protein